MLTDLSVGVNAVRYFQFWTYKLCVFVGVLGTKISAVKLVYVLLCYSIQ